jgi:type 2A phosphatase activator TIP41
MSAPVPVPAHKLTEDPNTRGIEVGGWHVAVATHPIANAGVLDAIYDALRLPLPEMTFANNVLHLRHAPSGWAYAFDATRALAGVTNGPLAPADGPVRVRHADAWLASRSACLPLSAARRTAEAHAQDRSGV